MSDFRAFIELSAFEKAGESNPKRIGGLITTESRDQQGERVLQDGLKFDYFLKRGYFNDNHGKRPSDVLGVPQKVKRVKKGDVLPDGSIAKANGHWAEGYLLEDYKPAQEIWELARALQKTPDRKLGFSIEGKVLSRADDGKTIAEAEVHHVAITHCPVNAETSLTALAKSLVTHDDFSSAIDEEIHKKDLTSFPQPANLKKGMNQAEVAVWLAQKYPGLAGISDELAAVLFARRRLNG